MLVDLSQPSKTQSCPKNIVIIKINTNDGLNMLLMEGKNNHDCVNNKKFKTV